MSRRNDTPLINVRLFLFVNRTSIEEISEQDGCLDSGMCVLTTEATALEAMEREEDDIVVDKCSWHTDRVSTLPISR